MVIVKHRLQLFFFMWSKITSTAWKYNFFQSLVSMSLFFVWFLFFKSVIVDWACNQDESLIHRYQPTAGTSVNRIQCSACLTTLMFSPIRVTFMVPLISHNMLKSIYLNCTRLRDSWPLESLPKGLELECGLSNSWFTLKVLMETISG